MNQIHTDASDGSVQEIAVNDRNPIGLEPVDRPAAEISHAQDTQAQDEQADHLLEATSSLLIDKLEASAAPAKIQTGMVSVALLRPYAKNADIYEDREDPLFAENIRKNGVLTDLVVTEDGETLGGNRRLREAKRAGLKEVPVKVVACQTEDEKMLRVLDDNVQRVKTNEEIAREYTERLQVEARAAALRKVEAGKKPKGQTKEVEKLTPPAKKKGKARDEAAKALKLSGVTADKGRKVLEAVAKVRDKGDIETADELLLKLNDEGFHSAFERAKALKLIVPAAKKGAKAKAAANPKAAIPAAPGAEVGAVAVPPAAEQAAPTMADDEDDDDAAVAAYIGAVAKLNDTMAENLTFDQRRNLLRAHDDAQDWFAYNTAVLNEKR